MKHVFIVNPVAGHHNPEEMIRSAAENYFSRRNGSYCIRVTQAPKHATEIAREESSSGEPVRLYACGGDGTLSEVAAGAFHFPNAEVASIPTGSGNDYIRNFGEKRDFLDLAAQIEGNPMRVDMIDFGEGRTAVNVCSCGYDADVAVNLERFKKAPFVSGSLAYALSCLYSLMKNISTRFEIRVDGQKDYSGEYLLTAFCNGGWYGGGFNVAPGALLSDGLLDFVLIDKVNRRQFLGLVSRFRAGEHESLKMIRLVRGRSISVRRDRPFFISVDGEVITADSIAFSVIPACLNFVLPKSIKHTEYRK